VARDQKDWRRVVLEAKVQCWRRRRKNVQKWGFPVHTMGTEGNFPLIVNLGNKLR
jgi:hypothetical protein